ncbi:hypothetical protein SLE2022_165170 [Rubroshorea leprosula]
MSSNSWTSRFSVSSSSSSSSARRCLNRSDLFFVGGYDEVDGDDDLKAEFLCPFCAEDFDIVGLCCHIDEEHPVEAKNGVCPVCGKRVGTDIVGHITMQHGSILRVQRRRRVRRVGSNLTFSMLRRELREGNLQALLGGSSFLAPSSSADPDPLLSSFIFSQPSANEPVNVQPLSMVGGSSVNESSKKELLQRNSQQPPLSDKDHKEKAQRSVFVQGLLLSTILDDDL